MDASLATDMHFHSSDGGSDGKRTLKELEEDITPTVKKFQGNVIAIVTDHNKATHTMKGKDYFTCAGVEVSTFETHTQSYAHLLLYAQSFSELVDKTLSGVRAAQMYNIGKNIDQLRSHGFDVTRDNFFTFFHQKGYDPGNLNNFQLARYVMSDTGNREKAGRILDREITNNIDGYVVFMKNFLRYNSDYAEYGYSEDKVTVGIEPTQLAEIAQRENGIISFAHPQVTCRDGIEQFRKMFHRYHTDYGVNAIEIPAIANDRWIDVIIELAKKYGCILTFGSDSHGYPADLDHADIMKLNPHITHTLHQKHAHSFRERFCESQTFAQVG